MLPQLISHSADLKQLFEDGFELSIVGGQLVVHNILYVTVEKKIERAELVSELSLNGDLTIKPSTHVIKFTGGHPCDVNGRPLAHMMHTTTREVICEGLVTQRTFSCKPNAGNYSDYHHKVSVYASMISIHAKRIDPTVTARTYAVTEVDEPATPFLYLDNASGIAGINGMTMRVAGQKVGIVGLGGTGSYLLDLIAKTPVAEIILFDGDDLIQHNAFRSPGAVPVTTLLRRPNKAEHHAQTYSVFRKGVRACAEFLAKENFSELDELDFVFICIDDGASKKNIIEYLEDKEKQFIDVGIGVEVFNGMLHGIVRTSTSTPGNRLVLKKSVSNSQPHQEDAYRANIQIAELNSLNACLAVIKWKKLNKIYADLEDEMNSNYTIDGNCITNASG